MYSITCNFQNSTVLWSFCLLNVSPAEQLPYWQKAELNTLYFLRASHPFSSEIKYGATLTKAYGSLL